MILGVYERKRRPVTKIAPGWPKAYQQATKDHSLWAAEPHLAAPRAFRAISILGLAPRPKV